MCYVTFRSTKIALHQEKRGVLHILSRENDPPNIRLWASCAGCIDRDYIEDLIKKPFLGHARSKKWAKHGKIFTGYSDPVSQSIGRCRISLGRIAGSSPKSTYDIGATKFSPEKKHRAIFAGIFSSFRAGPRILCARDEIGVTTFLK